MDCVAGCQRLLVAPVVVLCPVAQIRARRIQLHAEIVHGVGEEHYEDDCGAQSQETLVARVIQLVAQQQHTPEHSHDSTAQMRSPIDIRHETRRQRHLHGHTERKTEEKSAHDKKTSAK